MRAWVLHSDPREPPQSAKSQPHLLGWWPDHREAAGQVRCLQRRLQLTVPEPTSIDKAVPHKGNHRGGPQLPGAREMGRTRKSSGSSSSETIPSASRLYDLSECWASSHQSGLLSPIMRGLARSFGQFIFHSTLRPLFLSPNDQGSIHPQTGRTAQSFRVV